MMNLFSKWFWLVIIGGILVFVFGIRHFIKRFHIDEATQGVEEIVEGRKAPGTSEARSQIIYTVKGEISDRTVRALYPGLVLDGGLVVGYVEPGDEARTIKTLSLLDRIPARDPVARDPVARDPVVARDPARDPVPLALDPVARDPVEPEPLVPVSYAFARRQPDQALISSVQQANPSLNLDLSTGEVFGLVDPDQVQAVESYLRRLDKAPETVRLEAVFLQCTLSGSKDFSASWLVDVGAQRGFRNTDYRLRSQPGAFSITAGNFQGILQGAVNSGKVRVVSRPSIGLTLGIEGLLRSGREVAIPSSTVSNGVIQQQVEFRSIEFVVKVKVQKLTDLYRVAIEQESNEIVGRSEIGGDSVPEIASQGLTSSIDCKYGQWVFLGGVAKTSTSDVKTRSPWFLSKARSRSSERSEVVLAFRITGNEDKPSAYARKILD